MTTHQQDLQIPHTDGSIGAYLSESTSGGPGVVLLQEIFGVNPHIRSVADRLASAGYSVVAPDLFQRSEPGVQLRYDEDGFNHGFELLQALDHDTALADIAACIDYLRQRTNRKVAVAGFCLGGFLAFITAARLSPDAAVCYYPGGVGNFATECETVRCPIQFHFADNDDYVPADHVEKINSASRSLKQCEIHNYDAEHGFNCDARAHYHKAAADRAWQRTLTFLQQHLN